MIFGSFLMMGNHTEIVSVLVKEFPEWSGYEMWNIFVGSMLVIVTAFLLYRIHNQVKLQYEILEQQQQSLKQKIKTDSAKLIRDFDKETNSRFKTHLTKMGDNKKLTDKQRNSITNHFEELGIYWKDGIITFEHIDEMYGEDIKNFANNDDLFEYIENCAKLNNPTLNRLYMLIVEIMHYER